MALFSRKKKAFFTPEEDNKIVSTIREAERQTSGEIRVFVESRCKYVDPLDRAAEVFFKLKMEETEKRNGVLFYLALKDRQLAIFADKGIHEAVGEEYWKNEVKKNLLIFNKNGIVTGITTTITDLGEALRFHFPYDAEVDKNELPDEIIFGQ